MRRRKKSLIAVMYRARISYRLGSAGRWPAAFGGSPNAHRLRRAAENGTRSARTAQSQILLGAHMSIGGGVHTAIERGCSIKCTAIQIFVKNNMQWFARPLGRGEIRAFLDHRQRGELLSIFAHSNYLINLAATHPQFHANSIRALAEE